MPHNPKRSSPGALFCALFVLLGTVCSMPLRAWGPDGHAAIGVLSVARLQPGARQELQSILGELGGTTLDLACNWPDAMRDTAAWEWAAPQHYINIPRGDETYSQKRDCPTQLCLTEAIKTYAARLGDRRASRAQRWQAFAWTCHLVGDLHQPLHAGYADDRGGNEFAIRYAGKEMNLHTFWDRALIRQRAGDWRALVALLESGTAELAEANWTPSMVNEWTNRSHQLVEKRLYPAGPDINAAYEDMAWSLVQQQINLAATHLALIVNTRLRE